jgi:hypothetical protein
MTDTWRALPVEERQRRLEQCQTEGHDYYYIEGSAARGMYRWDCARCNWQEARRKATLPLNPSRQRERWTVVDQWAQL